MVLLSPIFSQSADFRFDSVACQDCDGHAKSVVYSSSSWLSETAAIDPNSKNRLMIQSGFSSTTRRIWSNYWTYPNLDFAIKTTNNLAITGKIYGFSTEKESPQVLGAGLQYFFGGKDTLDWVTSIQRIDLKGLNHYRLTSLTFDFRKWVDWKTFQFRIGVGSNFFKEQSYSGNHSAPSTMEGQINYFGLDALQNFSIYKVGLGMRINPNLSFLTLFLQKELF